MGEIPAKDAVERAGIENQLDSRMDTLTQEVYACGVLSGETVRKIRG